jgi:hypothetical protein
VMRHFRWMRDYNLAVAMHYRFMSRILPLDADGEMLPSSWDLKLADHAGRALRREIPLTPNRPMTS